MWYTQKEGCQKKLREQRERLYFAGTLGGIDIPRKILVGAHEGGK